MCIHVCISYSLIREQIPPEEYINKLAHMQIIGYNRKGETCTLLTKQRLSMKCLFHNSINRLFLIGLSRLLYFSNKPWFNCVSYWPHKSLPFFSKMNLSSVRLSNFLSVDALVIRHLTIYSVRGLDILHTTAT